LRKISFKPIGTGGSEKLITTTRDEEKDQITACGRCSFQEKKIMDWGQRGLCGKRTSYYISWEVSALHIETGRETDETT